MYEGTVTFDDSGIELEIDYSKPVAPETRELLADGKINADAIAEFYAALPVLYISGNRIGPMIILENESPDSTIQYVYNTETGIVTVKTPRPEPVNE